MSDKQLFRLCARINQSRLYRGAVLAALPLWKMLKRTTPFRAAFTLHRMATQVFYSEGGES